MNHFEVREGIADYIEIHLPSNRTYSVDEIQKYIRSIKINPDAYESFNDTRMARRIQDLENEVQKRDRIIATLEKIALTNN